MGFKIYLQKASAERVVFLPLVEGGGEAADALVLKLATADGCGVGGEEGVVSAVMSLGLRERGGSRERREGMEGEVEGGGRGKKGGEKGGGERGGRGEKGRGCPGRHSLPNKRARGGGDPSRKQRKGVDTLDSSQYLFSSSSVS